MDVNGVKGNQWELAIAEQLSIPEPEMTREGAGFPESRTWEGR